MRAAFIAALLCASPAFAQQPAKCGDAKALTQEMAQRLGEMPIASALNDNNNLMVLLANAETGTWTILTVFPAGHACIAAYGEAFDLVNEPNV